MMFSIPQAIYPVYSIPDSIPPNLSLNVGASIKDLPSGAETTMKKANDVAILRAQHQYEADSLQYDKDFQAAEIKASDAKRIIGCTRNKKVIAITSLAITIIAIVATVIAAAVTQTWPILFIAIPFLITLVPASYYTHIFRLSVNELEHDIAAPSKMKRPVLNLPVYNPKLDMDLLESRINLQNKLAPMSIRQIHDTKISEDEIVGYELLNRVTQIQSEKRPTFYAKCIQLINAYGKIDKEYEQYLDKAEREYKKLRKELREWKSQQDTYIQSQTFALYEQERIVQEINQARQRGELVNVHTRGVVGTILSRWELDRMKSQVVEGYGRRDAENQNWYEMTLHAIKSTYQRASLSIENQYSAAKATTF